MGFFDCCIKCKPPKSYPGCSAKCPEYSEQWILNEVAKAQERQRIKIGAAKTDYLNNTVWRNKKY
jgi:hypothetical protein